MTLEAERDLLQRAIDGFDQAHEIAIKEGDALKSIAVSIATAGKAVARILLNELDQ